MGIFDWMFGEAIEEGVRSGVENAFQSEETQLAFDRLMQEGYNLGREDERLGKPRRSFTLERHAKQGKK